MMLANHDDDENDNDEYNDKQAEKEASELKIKSTQKELLELKKAFDGDTCGWSEKKDDNKKAYYENAETGTCVCVYLLLWSLHYLNGALMNCITTSNAMTTGEIAYDMPVVMRVAEAMANVQAGQDIAKYKKQLEESKLQLRQQQVSLAYLCALSARNNDICYQYP